jgi:hypothetical protein
MHVAPRDRRTQRGPQLQHQHGRNAAEIRFHLKFNEDEISAFSDRRRDLKTLILAAAGFLLAPERSPKTNAHGVQEVGPCCELRAVLRRPIKIASLAPF